jgi:hypothetical protein
MPSDQDYRTMMEELLERDSGLTAWEIEFLDSLCDQGFRDEEHWYFTEKQLACFEKTYNRIFK